MGRRKHRKIGTVNIANQIKDCPKCDQMMWKEIKPDLSGKQFVCRSCGHIEG